MKRIVNFPFGTRTNIRLTLKKLPATLDLRYNVVVVEDLIASFGQVVVLGESFEEAAGQITHQQVETQGEQLTELLLEVAFDRLLGGQQGIQRAVESIFGDSVVGYCQPPPPDVMGVPRWRADRAASRRVRMRTT